MTMEGVTQHGLLLVTCWAANPEALFWFSPDSL